MWWWPNCVCVYAVRRAVRNVNKDIDDRVTDIAHQKLFYTIFGSLDFPNWRMPNVWEQHCAVWRNKQYVNMCIDSHIHSLSFNLLDAAQQRKGLVSSIACFLRNDPSKRTNKKLNGNSWLDRKNRSSSNNKWSAESWGRAVSHSAYIPAVFAHSARQSTRWIAKKRESLTARATATKCTCIFNGNQSYCASDTIVGHNQRGMPEGRGCWTLNKPLDWTGRCTTHHSNYAIYYFINAVSHCASVRLHLLL